MATFLFSGLLALAVQTPPTPPPPPGPAVPPGDSARAALWAQVAADSTDGAAWLALGRAYLRLAAGYHAHRAPPAAPAPPAPGAPDSAGGGRAGTRALLDTAEQALARGVQWNAGTGAGDSARVLQVASYAERAFLEWEAAGTEAAIAAWRRLPDTLRLPPVLEELGENLLRACPQGGILFTAGDLDTYAAWFLQFARGLRPDLLIVPLARRRADTVFRGYILRALDEPDGSLRALGERRALCASLAFERPPEGRPPVRWKTRPLVWVAGQERPSDRVPAQDFAFAALRLAVDEQQTWSAPALAVYRRAVSEVGALCRPLRTFGLRAEVGC